MFSKIFIIKSILLSFILLSIIFLFYSFFYSYCISDFFNYKLLFIVPLTIVIHEFFHFLGFSIFNFSLKGITFGISKNFIPYTRTTNNISKTQFIIAAIFPFLILGLGAFIISLFYFNSNLITFTIINVSGCSGDFLIILRKLKKIK